MWGIVNLRFRVFTLLLSMSAIAVGGCASVYNLPANRPLLSPVPVYDVGRMDPSFDDDVLLMLSFFGGGTRAAAFSFGIAGARPVRASSPRNRCSTASITSPGSPGDRSRRPISA